MLLLTIWSPSSDLTEVIMCHVYLYPDSQQIKRKLLQAIPKTGKFCLFLLLYQYLA